MDAVTKPRPTGTFKGTDLGDEFLFYDRDNDRVHVLNATAREIFLLFDGTRTQDDVAAVLVERFDVELPQAQSDVENTTRQLRELGLID